MRPVWIAMVMCSRQVLGYFSWGQLYTFCRAWAESIIADVLMDYIDALDKHERLNEPMQIPMNLTFTPLEVGQGVFMRLWFRLIKPCSECGLMKP